MVKKLGELKIDNHGRAQIPVQVRRYLGVGPDGKVSVWEVEEKVVLERSVVGTPNVFKLKPSYRSVE